MSKPKFYKWTVEFQVSANWIEDGFEITPRDEAKADLEAQELCFMCQRPKSEHHAEKDWCPGANGWTYIKFTPNKS